MRTSMGFDFVEEVVVADLERLGIEVECQESGAAPREGDPGRPS